MKTLRPTRRRNHDAGFDARVEYAHDVEQLIRAALSHGYHLSHDDAVELWMRHSVAMCASWLTMDATSDVELVRAMREHSAVVDEPIPAIKPPGGYASWLDYAVESMDTRQPYLDHTRETMRQAAQAELLYLRRLAAL
jgi:hypothetical protein